MLNFEEELKKFAPSMEIEQIEDVINNHTLTDMTDIMLEMMNREKQTADAVAMATAAEVLGQQM